MTGAPSMDRGLSLWLDLLRVLATLTVLLGHAAHLRFTDGAMYALREWNVASDAVIVFFVLSGVVIAYAAERDGTLGRFAFNRLTRLWTVLLPALLLTIVLDRIGLAHDAGAYLYPNFQPLPPEELLLRGLTFTNEWQGSWDRVRLGTNGPIWSLSYEAAFYAMFGAATFLRGALRIVVVALLAALAGLPILALAPAWFVGVAVWRIVRDGTRPAPSVAHAWALFLGSPAAVVACKVMAVDHGLAALTRDLLAPVHYQWLLGYSDEMLWNTALAVGVGLHLLGARALGPRIANWIDTRTARSIRWVAGASFSVYVVHYPVLHLADATLPEAMAFKPLVFVALPLLCALLFAELFERPLRRVRRLLLDAGAALRAVRAT